MIRSSVEVNYRRAFLCTEETIRRLSEVLERVGPSNWHAALTDGSTLYFNQSDELLRFQNPPVRQISELRISSDQDRSTTAARTSVQLRLINQGGIGQSPIRLQMDGPDDLLLRLRRDIEDILSTSRVPYSLISVYSDIIAFGLAVLTAVLLLLAAISVAPKGPGSGAMALWVIFGMVGAMFGAMWFFSKALPRVFPAGTFALGDGKKRATNLDTWRNTIGFGVFGAFIIALVAELIAQRL